MPTLKELQLEAIDIQHKLSVWESLADHLDQNFISKDGTPAPKALRSPGCLVDKISEPAIEEVIRTIYEGPIKELKEELQKFENQEVTLKKK